MTIPPKPRIFLQLLASALFAIGLVPAIAAAQTTYTNSARIILPNSVVASTYPSTITVSGATRPIAKVTVTLNRVNQRPNDLEVLLVGPTGVKVSLMQDSGGNGQANNQVWTFDDAATGMMPGSAATGTYKPSFDSGIALTCFLLLLLRYPIRSSFLISSVLPRTAPGASIFMTLMEEAPAGIFNRAGLLTLLTHLRQPGK